METRRWLLFFALSFIVIQLFMIITQKNKPVQNTQADSSAGMTSGTLAGADFTTGTAPENLRASNSVAAAAPVAARRIENTSITIEKHPGPIVTAETDKYKIGVDTVGAVVHSWRLLDPGSESYKHNADTSQGIEMVRRIPKLAPPSVGEDGASASAVLPEQFVSQTWPLEVTMTEANGPNYEDFNNVPWEKRGSASTKGDAMMQFVSPPIKGLRIQKTWSFPKDKYLSNLRVTVFNDTSSTVKISDEANRGLTLRWGPGLVERDLTELTNSSDGSYDGGVLRGSNGVKSFIPHVDKDPLETDDTIEWAGVESKFFAALIMPEQPDDAARKKHYFFRALVPSAHKVDYKGYVPPLTVELSTDKFDIPPNSSVAFEYGIYVGPKKHSILAEYKHHFETLMFHTSWPFMRAIYLLLTGFLNMIYKFVGNYGIAIMLLTISVRLLTFPLTQHQIRIQAKTTAEMQKIKPYLDQINEKYKDKPEEKNRQTWKVYQEHGISPFSSLRGCVPVLLQMPIFVGLYRVSNDTIDLKGAHFLWIHDLSQADHLIHLGVALPIIGLFFNLLPILMGATQMLSTRIAMARVSTMDPTQKQMMYFMPLMMAFMCYSLPAGLMLYWIASNTWQIFQTMYVNRNMARDEAEKIKSGQAVPFTPHPKDVAIKENGPAKGNKK